jgi:hypothetical protein
MLRGRSVFLLRQFHGTTTLLGSDRSPPCVCGRDVIEATDGLAAVANRGWLSFRESRGQLLGGAAGGGDRTAQGRLRPAAADRVATGMVAQRFAHHPERAWHCWYASPKNGHVKVRDIAQAIINAHCGRLSPAEVEILSVIDLHMPDGVRLIGARVDG